MPETAIHSDLPTPVRHAISLLVHEQVEVIVEQCRNFEFFAPEALIMLHVSMTASFAVADLEAALAAAGCRRSFINPQSVPTKWGQLIAAHFANIRALAPFCSKDTTVSFHASNDMLLRELPPMGAPGLALFEQREVSRSAPWVMGREWARSPSVPPLLEAMGCRKPVGGQVEGVSLPYALAAELTERLLGAPEVMADLPHIAEELVFSTFASDRIGEPAGMPTIYFRKNRLPGFCNYIVPRPLRGTLAGRAVVSIGNRISSRISPDEATIRDVDAVIAGKAFPRDHWALGMPKGPPVPYYGIKRVDRRMDSPTRRHIRARMQDALARG